MLEIKQLNALNAIFQQVEQAPERTEDMKLRPIYSELNRQDIYSVVSELEKLHTKMQLTITATDSTTAYITHLGRMANASPLGLTPCSSLHSSSRALMSNSLNWLHLLRREMGWSWYTSSWY
jgi:hypothetical protein